MYMSTKSIKIFSGTSNPGLSHEICKYLNVPLSHVTIGRFPDGEISVQIQESIRGDDVFIIQPTNYPANDNLMLPVVHQQDVSLLSFHFLDMLGRTERISRVFQ